MDAETIRNLSQLNEDFYNQVSEPFNQTRQQPWAGWHTLVTAFKTAGEPTSLKVLDVGCGNGRFGTFLIEQFPGVEIKYVGLDNNQALLNEAKSALKDRVKTLHLIKVNIVHQLLLFEDILPEADFDIVVAFGVLHHIPGFDLRRRLVTMLSKKIKPEGFAAVTGWQFFNDERLRNKIVAPSEVNIRQDELEPNDYILSWDREIVAYRYCHFCDLAELSVLSEAISKPTRFFAADGKSGQLNQYLVTSENETFTLQIGQ